MAEPPEGGTGPPTEPGKGSMRGFANSVVNFLKRSDEEGGPTAVEYAVMLALVIVVCITAITAVGTAEMKKQQKKDDEEKPDEPQIVPVQ